MRFFVGLVLINVFTSSTQAQYFGCDQFIGIYANAKNNQCYQIKRDETGMLQVNFDTRKYAARGKAQEFSAFNSNTRFDSRVESLKCDSDKLVITEELKIHSGNRADNAPLAAKFLITKTLSLDSGTLKESEEIEVLEIKQPTLIKNKKRYYTYRNHAYEVHEIASTTDRAYTQRSSCPIDAFSRSPAPTPVRRAGPTR